MRTASAIAAILIVAIFVSCVAASRQTITSQLDVTAILTSEHEYYPPVKLSKKVNSIDDFVKVAIPAVSPHFLKGVKWKTEVLEYKEWLYCVDETGYRIIYVRSGSSLAHIASFQ